MSKARWSFARLCVSILIVICFSVPIFPQSKSKLSLSIELNKRRYRWDEQMTLNASLVNLGQDSIYIFGELFWGYRVAFLPRLLDSSGKEMDLRIIPDEVTLSSPEEQSAFVKLFPYQFLGSVFRSSINDMVTKPGRYGIYVEYLPRFSVREVKPQPFWGSENGTLKSKVVYFEVVKGRSYKARVSRGGRRGRTS